MLLKAAHYTYSKQIARKKGTYLQRLSRALCGCKPEVKARTHRSIFRGLAAESAVESANSIPESADYTTDLLIVGRQPLSNLFNILNPEELADGKLLQSADGKWAQWVLAFSLTYYISGDRRAEWEDGMWADRGGY